jgi:hypothetical protein
MRGECGSWRSEQIEGNRDWEIGRHKIYYETPISTPQSLFSLQLKGGKPDDHCDENPRRAKNVEAVVKRVEELGYKVHLSRGEARTIIGVIGADEHLIQNSTFEVMDGVERTMRVMQPYKLASRDFSAANTVIEVNGVQIGGNRS